MSPLTAFIYSDIIDVVQTILTPWCRVLLEKLTDLQLVKKFPAFHGTRRFITALTSVRHLSLSRSSPIQSIYSHPTEIRSNIIHPSTPRSPQWSLSLRFPHQDPIHPPLLTHLNVWVQTIDIATNDCGLTKEIRSGYFVTKSKHEYAYVLSRCLF